MNRNNKYIVKEPDITISGQTLTQAFTCSVCGTPDVHPTLHEIHAREPIICGICRADRVAQARSGVAT